MFSWWGFQPVPGPQGRYDITLLFVLSSVAIYPVFRFWYFQNGHILVTTLCALCFVWAVDPAACAAMRSGFNWPLKHSYVPGGLKRPVGAKWHDEQ